ncbi:hypothetical protein ACG0Z6_13005 [Roseateles sp. BYS180W]|uniref:Histidine kinase n=1 Tax=Roseateles rivi TaxID=3299028 RepID=A0ABW7FXX4_9BURK
MSSPTLVTFAPPLSDGARSSLSASASTSTAALSSSPALSLQTLPNMLVLALEATLETLGAQNTAWQAPLLELSGDLQELPRMVVRSVSESCRHLLSSGQPFSRITLQAQGHGLALQLHPAPSAAAIPADTLRALQTQLSLAGAQLHWPKAADEAPTLSIRWPARSDDLH